MFFVIQYIQTIVRGGQFPLCPDNNIGICDKGGADKYVDV